MKSEKILYALTRVREDFVEQSVPERRKPARVWMKYAVAAACLCVVLAGALALGTDRTGPGATDTLPVIDLPELDFGSMGFEGYMYYDASEIENGNPWREDMVFETMPVFKSKTVGWDGDEIMRRLERAAAALGTEILETETNLDQAERAREKIERYNMEMEAQGLPPAGPEEYGLGDGSVTYIGARTEVGTLRGYEHGSINYEMWSNYPWNLEYGLEPIKLPEQYSFTHYDTTTEQALETMKYLTQTYAELLDLDEPAFVVSGEYNIYGQYSRSYSAYNASGDNLQDILNYTFRRASFGPNDDGRLSSIWVSDGFTLLEKIGDYPIISIDEAQERLLSGQYQTSVPYEMTGEEHIAKVELMYRNSAPLEEVVLPYYRFYVELPEEDFGSVLGLKTFGAYYVPAIESEYIGNAEIYHGQFN